MRGQKGRKSGKREAVATRGNRIREGVIIIDLIVRL